MVLLQIVIFAISGHKKQQKSVDGLICTFTTILI